MRLHPPLHSRLTAPACTVVCALCCVFDFACIIEWYAHCTGFNAMVRVFDVNNPGRNHTDLPTLRMCTDLMYFIELLHSTFACEWVM